MAMDPKLVNILIIVGVIFACIYGMRKFEKRWGSYPEPVWQRLEEAIKKASEYTLTAEQVSDPKLKSVYSSRAVGILEAVAAFESPQHIEDRFLTFDTIRGAALNAEAGATSNLANLLPNPTSPEDDALNAAAGWAAIF